MKTRVNCVLSLVFVTAIVAMVGCSSTVDELTNSVDCHTVCTRYADCFNSDYDVDGCTDRCEHGADTDAERERKLKMCNTCIDDRSCKVATFNCADDCAGVVP